MPRGSMLAEAGELDAEFTDIMQSGRSAGENNCKLVYGVLSTIQ